ncbi:MAG TPA: cysteine peptidase family C39 domain-containing protein, partial [Burkholderiaceae bacterium]|nr:cysteine peptidase family C39 domain-containing protein [Burkholderiaceae bacterium]
MSVPYQHSAIQCLTAIAQHHGIQVNPERIIHDNALADEEPSPSMLLRIAAEIGLKAKFDKLSWDALFAQGGVFPILARLKNGHSVIIVGARAEHGGRIAVLDPLAEVGGVELITREQFFDRWEGDVVFLKRQHSIADPNQPFGLRWFIPEILKQKTAFRDIAIAAVMLHILALASPIFFQLVIDKVLV